MSIDRGYTNRALISSFLGKTIDTDLTPYILGAQSLIENSTGRIFAPDKLSSIRLFNGGGTNEIIIDDCSEITKIEVSDDGWGDSFEEIPITDYHTLPVDETLPIRKILSRYKAFAVGSKNVRITGKWGWRAIPADISFCATALASGMYQAQITSNNLKSESIGQYSVSYQDKDWSDFEKLKVILKQYENIEI